MAQEPASGGGITSGVRCRRKLRATFAMEIKDARRVFNLLLLQSCPTVVLDDKVVKFVTDHCDVVSLVQYT